MANQRSKHKWIDAGLKALAVSGIAAVRVEVLARELNVTKGSFYWHFKNRNDLLKQIFAHWKSIATADIIDKVDGTTSDPHQRLLHLLTIVLGSDGRLEQAVRSWAAIDPAIFKQVSEIDLRRTSYMKDLFALMGFSERQAKLRAALAYRAYIGELTLSSSPSSLVSDETQLREVLSILTSPDHTR